MQHCAGTFMSYPTIHHQVHRFIQTILHIICVCGTRVNLMYPLLYRLHQMYVRLQRVNLHRCRYMCNNLKNKNVVNRWHFKDYFKNFTGLKTTTNMGIYTSIMMSGKF